MKSEKVEINGKNYVQPDVLTYGDYVGDLVAKSNVLTLVKMAEERGLDIQESCTGAFTHHNFSRICGNPDVICHFSDYNTEAIYLLEESDFTKEILNSLKNYPSLDDEKFFEVEKEEEKEAFDFISSSVISEIESFAKKLNPQDKSLNEAVKFLFDCEDRLFPVYLYLKEKNVFFADLDGSSFWIDESGFTKEVVKLIQENKQKFFELIYN